MNEFSSFIDDQNPRIFKRGNLKLQIINRPLKTNWSAPLECP
jgi:hypothetical protein